MLWIVCLWLCFALLYPAYHPAKGEKGTSPRDIAEIEAGLAEPYQAAYWSWELSRSAFLAVPAILLAVPLWFTLGGSSSGSMEQ